MPKFEVRISTSVLKELNSIDGQTISRIKTSLKELNEDPFLSRPKADIKKMKGFSNPDMFRLRVGDYRIVYTVDEKVVKITHILHRSSIYKRLD